jgi:putative ABC transport system permease protein
MPALASALRLVFRQLRKAPGFTITVVLTLALGIGATTAIFSLVEGILLRPLSFHDPDRLVDLGDHLGDSPNLPVTAREISTYATSATAFSSIGADQSLDFELSGDATPSVVQAARLTTSVFPTLGVAPVLGRVFTQQEDDSRAPVAVLSYALWVNRYHRDPQIVGSTITLSRRNYTILGVMPRSFEYPLAAGRLDQAQLWVPMSLTANDLADADAGAWGFHLVARLKPGVTFAEAAQDANRVAQQVMRNFPAALSSVRIRGDVRPLRAPIVRDAGPLLRSLFLAVSIVLLIACVNVAVLLLVRALRRRREHAVRLALGASAGIILRASIAEGLLLSLSGGLLGLALAAAALRMVLHLLPDSLPRIDSVSINLPVALFALLLAIATGVLCSLAPAFAAVRTNLLEGLKDDARSGSGSARQGWLRSMLVAAEIAIALVLLTVSLAFVRSYQKMLAVDPGFLPDHELIAGYELPASHYATDASIQTFNREVVARLAAQPAVSAVGLSNFMPANGRAGEAAYTIEGAPLSGWKLKFAPFIETYGDYFRAMGTHLLAGRTFTLHDHADAPLVVIVNQSMARHAWPGQNPIGKRMHIGNPHHPLPWATVVGVVADTKLGAPDEPAADQFYFPMEQPAIIEGAGASGMLATPVGYIALRSTLPPEQMIHTLRSVVAGLDPQLALDPVRPMADALSNVEAPRRFNTRLIAAFALAALLLAAMGIYAAMAFSVSLRTQEIAIRMALGAPRSAIARLILGSGARIALFGCLLGVLGSLAAAHLVAAFLFDVSATDPWIYAASVGLMILLALVASALPARRAAAADPVASLRAV